MFFIIILFLTGCLQAPADTPTPTALPTATLPGPSVRVTKTPDARLAAQAFLDGWKNGAYDSMYPMLTEESRQAISAEKFVQRYRDVENEAGLVGVDATIRDVQVSPEAAVVNYQVVLHSGVFGDFVRDMIMNLTLESNQWRVAWNDALIMPELAGGNYLKMDAQTTQRQAIYDRLGRVIVDQTTATSIGVYPDYINPEEDKGLLSLLAQVAGRRAGNIAGLIEMAYPGAFIPVGEVANEDAPRLISALSSYGAVLASEYTSRFYYNNGIAPHVIGYVSAIQEDEIAKYRRKGLSSAARVGRKGLELWGEDLLVGRPGGTLYLFSPDGQIVSTLGETLPQPGQEITTTIDSDLQLGVQAALRGFRAAAVVIEKDTGRVLAMASSPGFDPNAYEFNNSNWQAQLSEYTNDPWLPQFNRAAQGQYPLGSVFKVITMAAGLESGRFTADSTYDCQYDFTDLPGLVLHDWTWEHFQEDGKTKPSGILTLPQGLIKSCNPWFYHIGLDLFNAGQPNAVSEMARGFGLGSKTGIVGIDEEAGNIPDAPTAVDATNIAIGQGDVQVTPLQVANFMAAVGNGGTLYRPQLIEKIAMPGGNAISFSFEPEVIGELPVSKENLALIQDAMEGVAFSRKPMGTAYLVFSSLKVTMAGKTGTATSGQGEPHAWFAGFTEENREDMPDIAVAVIVENIGEGSEWAAPIFRRIVEVYFFGEPKKTYPWESSFGLTKTPTPLWTQTPTPTEEE